MTLILTTTCHYALLVAIEEGAGFPSLGDRDIFIQSRLSLHLPDTVGDLIPPSTIISAKPTKLVPNPQWRTTLVYFLSEKLLKRLRRQQAQVTLQIKTMAAEQGSMLELGTATLKVDQAKVIKMARGQQPLNILKNYVIDKGEWNPIQKGGSAQIKAGLFVVDMPPPAGERQRELTTTPISRPSLRFNKSSNKKMDDDLGLEIYSVNTSDSLTTTNSSSKDTDGDNDSMTDQWRINLDQYSTTNKIIKIKDSISEASPTLPSPSPSPPSSIVNCLEMNRRKTGQTPYLQIGTGQQRYTFVFRIVEATAVTSLLLSSKGQSVGIIRNSLQYTFSEWQIKHDVISKGNSWSVTDPPMRLLLQGHLHDLQQWLFQQGQIEVCLVQVATKCDHTIGKAMVRLKGWCPLTIEQASFPIHDRSNRLHVDQPFQFAKVVVQLGLISGWGGDDLRRDGLILPMENDDDTLVQQHKDHPFLYPNLIN